MNRPAFLLMLALVAPSAAQAPPSRPVVPKPAPSDATPVGRFEVSAYGDNDPTITDKAVPVNKALLDAAAFLNAYEKANPGYTTKAVVHVPASNGPRWTRTPISFPRGNIELIGDGPGSRIMAVGTSGHPVVTIGFPDTSANGFAPGPSVRPDCFRVLDSTAAPSAGKRLGVAIGPAFLVGYGCAFDRGGPVVQGQSPDSWTQTSTLTIDAAIAPAAGATTIPAGCWIGSPNGFGLWSRGNGLYQFYFRTQARRFAPHVTTTCSFTAPNLDGLKRISIQLDLTGENGPAVAAWVDGVQVRVGLSGQPTKGPLTLAQNLVDPYGIGWVDGQPCAPFGQKTSPFNILGHCFSRTPRYKVSDPGTAQQRADGQPINDRYRYFPIANVGAGQAAVTDPGYIAALALDDPATSRWLRVAGGNDYDSKMYLGDPGLYGPGAAMPTQGGNATRNLAIYAGTYGPAILTRGGILDLTIEDCTAKGGPYALATFPGGANYGNTMRRCKLAAWEAALALHWGGWRLREIDVNSGGRAVIRAKGCSIDASDLSVWQSSANQEYFAQLLTDEYGGSDSFRNVMIDNEDIGYAGAIFLMQRHPYGITRLRIEDCYAAQVGPASPYIDLDDVAGPPNSWTWQPAILAASGLRSDGACLASARGNGPGWVGRVTESVLPAAASTGAYGASTVSYVNPLATPSAVPASPPATAR